MKQQLAMVIDSSKCIDCKGCMLSCKVANSVPPGFWRNWIKVSDTDYSAGPATRTHFQPGGCMHCDTPTCVHACPTGATYKDETTGEVVIDKELCIGCGNCIPACPYGARYRNPQLKKADKCNYCPERRAYGLMPACVDTCPTKARVFGDILDPESEAAMLLKENKDRLVRVVNAETDTRPNMYYLGDTAPDDWTHPAQPPVAMAALTSWISPTVKGIVALSGIGVLAMFGRMLMTRGQDAHGEGDRHE